MGKRYYCDYCERSFKDDTEARKKHLSSLQHTKNRSDHYSSFKDPATILSEERLKTICKRFVNSGECPYSNGCKFSHYTPSAIRRLQEMAETKRTSHLDRRRPNLGGVPAEYFGAELTAAAAAAAAASVASTEQATERIEQYPEWWSIPPSKQLTNNPNLPPSLWPITPETVTDSDFGEWGFR